MRKIILPLLFAIFSNSIIGAVYLTGTFNSWAVANPSYELTDNGNGVLYISVPLAAGNHHFKLTDGSWSNSVLRDRIINLASPSNIKIYARGSKNFVCDTQDTIFVNGSAVGNQAWDATNMIPLTISGQQASATTSVFASSQGQIYRKLWGSNSPASSEPIWRASIGGTGNFTTPAVSGNKKLEFDFATYSVKIYHLAPVLNAATAVSTTGFTANWNAVGNASSYDVRVFDNLSNQVGSTINTASGNTTTSISGLSSNTSYTYTVTAKGDNVNYFDSNASNAIAVTTAANGTYLSGTFNSWDVANATYKLSDNGNGVLYISVSLAAGNHHFKLTDGSWNNSVLRDRIINLASPSTIKIYARGSKNFVCDTQDTIFVNGSAVGNQAWDATNMIPLTISGQKASATTSVFASSQSQIYRKLWGSNSPASSEPIWRASIGGAGNFTTPAVSGNKKLEFDFATYSLSTYHLAPILNAATAVSTTGFTANWNVVTNASSYDIKVYNGATLISTTNTGLNTGSSTSMVIAGLSSSTPYTYTVTAKGDNTTYYDSDPSSSNLVSTTTATTDNFRSKASGNWGNNTIWESSFDNTNWVSASIVPTSAATSITILNGHIIALTQNLSITDLTLNSGSTLNVNAGFQLTISTSFANNGTLSLLSDNSNGTATILTPTTIAGSGTYNIQLFLAGGRNWYLSSPITNANTTTVLGTSTAAIKPSSFVWYDQTKGSTTPWTTETSALAVARGYIATNPTYPDAPSTDGIITFSGNELNNGNVIANLTRTTGQTKEGFNLIGNPYPSYVDLSTFTQTSDTVHLESTYWLRSKTADNSAYVFDTYNLKTPASSITLSGKPVAGVIAPMQAFWVRVKSGFNSGSFTFRNVKRSHIDNSNNILRAPASSTFTQSLIRLQVSTGINYDETVLYNIADASNGYDDYDSQKYSNGSASIPEIFTVGGGERLAINGMNSIPYDTEIPIGFGTGTAGNNFCIKASQIANFEAGTQIFLKDYIDIGNPITANLSDGSIYTFSSAITSNNSSRFALIFKAPSGTTGINSPNNSNHENLAVWIFKNMNNQITVHCKEIIGNYNVSLYNALGQKLIEKQLTKTTTILENELELGIYVVVVKNNENSVTKKVIVN